MFGMAWATPEETDFPTPRCAFSAAWFILPRRFKKFGHVLGRGCPEEILFRFPQEPVNDLGVVGC